MVHAGQDSAAIRTCCDGTPALCRRSWASRWGGGQIAARRHRRRHGCRRL